jgi:poly-gamma-glutamate capsule biosynthesis protein CapA/YwtB (metallophosphatase superfamily)
MMKRVVPAVRFTLALLGDIMTGRLVDQVLPFPIPNEFEHGRSISSLGATIRKSLHLESKNQDELEERPWGDTLTSLQNADCVLGNLETSITKRGEKVPQKVFHYRMAPENFGVLLKPPLRYVCLANNHVLDYGNEGLSDTLANLDHFGIHHAGAGMNDNEAREPAYFEIEKEGTRLKILAFSFSDHPEKWAAGRGKPGINYLPSEENSSIYWQKAADDIRKYKSERGLDTFCIVSFHWGPNYSWKPSHSIQELAKRLVDAGADIVHGHSAHHLQGISVYKKSLILFGCGDAIDDYAVDPLFRNDIGMIWNVDVDANGTILSLKGQPTKIHGMQTNFLRSEEELKWTHKMLQSLCAFPVTPIDSSQFSFYFAS